MGIDCMKQGAEKVFISSITFCERVDPDRINRVNEMLRNECSKNGFTFIANNDINKAHLWKDGLHLNEFGQTTLAQNFIDNVNSFLCRDFRPNNQT